jgi:hypothetical protein
MKNFYLLTAFLLITGFSFGQVTGIPIDDGTPTGSQKGVIHVESDGSRSTLSLPDYYNYNTDSDINNSFPWNISSGKKVQLLYLPGDFNQPSPAPAGNITSISFRIADTYPLGPATYTDLTIKMGQSAITSFTAGSFYPGPLTTVYYRASVSLTGIAGDWMTITLDTPFAYDPAQSLIIDIAQCGETGASGFSMCFTNLSGNRRIWSHGGCPFAYEGFNSSAYHLGISFEPVTHRIYGSTGSVGGALIGINPLNGLGSLIGPLNAFGPVTEIQSDPTGTFLYGATGFGTSKLITINPVTAAEALVGTHPYGALNGLEFVENTLYGTFIPQGQQPSTLVIVNPVNAALTPIGPTGRGPIGGLAFDRNSSIMYGITSERNIPSLLVTINLTTGLATPIGSIGVAAECRGLVFDVDGTLYTATSQLDALPGFLIKVNPATGAGTLVGPTGFPAVSGLAVLEPQPQSIPVSNWALFIGIGLILVFALIRFRRII